MNRADPPSRTVAAVVFASTIETRLSGRGLILARVFWIVIAIFYLGMFAVSLPGLVMQLQTTCTSSCASWQLAPDAVRTLEHAGLSLGDYVSFSLVVVVMLTLTALAVVALLLWRRSDDWMALLVGLMLLSFGPSSFTNTVVLSAWFGPALATHLLSLSDGLNLSITALVFYLFPNGRFVPHWTRWIMWMGLGVSIFFIIFPRSSSAFLNALSGILYISVLLSLVMAQIYRYRRVSTPAQRQQTKWVVYSLAVLILLALGLFGIPQLIFPVLGQPGSLFSSLGTIVSDSLLVLLPISFGIAILRYRLYDIDILINRTLVYGLLTLVLILVYAGMVFSGQALLTGLLGTNDAIVIVVSTLMVAVLFQPLRHRFQRSIDRRFYRHKYDAKRIIDAFSSTLRAETELTQVSEQLVAVVQETMQPAHISLWLRRPESALVRNTRLLPRIEEEEGDAP
jgi:hypothetical protein